MSYDAVNDADELKGEEGAWRAFDTAWEGRVGGRI